MSAKIKTCLWFDSGALPAAEFYCSLIPGSEVTHVSRHVENATHGEPGTVLAVEFTLSGTPYQAINGGPHFTLSEAVSISVSTEDQEETDRLWQAITTDGGTESQCGWCKDRFGLSWQIVPKRAVELFSGPQASKVWPVLMTMRKIDIAALEAAARS